MSAGFAALLSLASAVMVAFLSHLFSEKRTRRNDLAQVRLRAYSDYFHATFRLMATRRLGETNICVEELAALNDAKARICLSADIPVVKALTEFWLAGGTLEREEEGLAFKGLCERMRESLGNEQMGASVLNFSQTLFQLEPSSYSYRAEKSNAASAGQPEA